MGNCKDCKYWKEVKHMKFVSKSKGVCGKVKQEWDCFEWDFLSDECDLKLKEEYSNHLAFARDGSDYYAYLTCFEDFGCVQFEEKQ